MLTAMLTSALWRAQYCCTHPRLGADVIDWEGIACLAALAAECDLDVVADSSQKGVVRSDLRVEFADLAEGRDMDVTLGATIGRA